MDGGTFSSDIDGGGLTGFAPIDIYDGIEVSLSSQYLFDSGNSILRLATGIGYSFVIETGRYSKFYKITPTISNNTYNLGLANEVIKIIPDDKYKIYNSADNIIYSTHSGQNFTVSGRTANNSISTVIPTVNSYLYSSGLIQSLYGNYDYYNFQPMDSYNIIPSQHLLYVYNLNSQESIDIKNYYFQMRTGITGANILGINCNIGYSGETTDTGNYINNIRTPIHRFIMTGNKPIKYGCLLHGIPTRITGVDTSNCVSVSVNYDLSNSLNQFSGYSRPNQFTYPIAFYQKHKYKYLNSQISPSLDRPFLFEEYTGTSALFTHLCSLQTRTADVSGYIRKICEDGKVSGVYLLGSGQNNLFVCYSNGGYGFYTDRVNLDTFEHNRELSFYSGLGINISFSKVRTEIPHITGYNICGFTSDGWHSYLFTGGTGDNQVDGPGGNWESSSTSCQFSGYNWYLSSHYESFAGCMMDENNGIEMNPHSPISKQIRPTAMGGTNYSNIPIGFVGPTLEPAYQGIEKIKMYDAWFKGFPFIEAAYIGLYRDNYFVWGDPLTKWR